YAETPQDAGARGWIATANQRVHAPDYPHFLTQDWAVPYRQQRIETLLQGTPQHDLASMAEIQGDQHAESTMRLLPHLLKAPSEHALAARARASFEGFTGEMRADSPAPLIFSAWVDEFARGVIGQRLGRERFEAMYG